MSDERRIRPLPIGLLHALLGDVPEGVTNEDVRAALATLEPQTIVRLFSEFAGDFAPGARAPRPASRRQVRVWDEPPRGRIKEAWIPPEARPGFRRTCYACRQAGFATIWYTRTRPDREIDASKIESAESWILVPARAASKAEPTPPKPGKIEPKREPAKAKAKPKPAKARRKVPARRKKVAKKRGKKKG